MRKLAILNLVLLLVVISYLIFADRKCMLGVADIIVPEITTERLNIVGENGTKYMVLSNPEKQALATINGKPVNPEKTERNVAGLLFFNEEGDEIGGLVYGIDSTDSYQLLTFDQRKNDQIMSLRKDEYLEDGKWKKQYGLLLQERSDKEHALTMSELNELDKISDADLRERKLDSFYRIPENRAPQRLFIGRTYSENVGLYLMDKDNKPRLQLYVDKAGQPHIESFDSNGNKKILQ